MEHSRQMCLLQSIQKFCIKYDLYGTGDEKSMLTSALNRMSLDNTINSKTDEYKDVQYLKTDVYLLKELIIKNGLFTPEQINDLAKISVEIRFCT